MYQNLVNNIWKLWDVNAAVVPMVVGELGTVSTELERHLKRIETTPCCQKAPLLVTAIILRRVIGISELT